MTIHSQTRAVLRDQMSAELIKVSSARTLWALPVMAAALGPVTALFVGLTSSLDSDDTLLGGALTGLTLSLAVVAAWGALLVTTEYSSGTIRPTLAATPQRAIVLAAKAIVAAVIGSMSGLLATNLAYLVGRMTIDASKYAPGDVFPGFLGIYCCFPAVALLGVAAGFTLRSSVGAVAVVTAHVVLPQLSAAQAFGDLHKWTTLIAPSAVVAKLSQNSDAAPELMGSLGGWPRLALVLVGIAGALVVARRIVVHQDA
ncbi:hypothetical protein [Nocardia sp. X0981]